MTNTQLEKKITKLERENETLIKEIIEVDQLMRDVGFIDGLNSLKATAEQLNQEPKTQEPKKNTAKKKKPKKE